VAKLTPINETTQSGSPCPLAARRRLQRSGLGSAARPAQRLAPRGALSAIAQLLFVLLALAGCGEEWSSVSGSLSLDGKPLASGENLQVTVLFNPAAGGAPPAAAVVDAEGNYSVSTGSRGGLAPGAYVVTLSAMELTYPSGAGTPPQRRLVTPRRYTQPTASDLRCDVQRGRNTFNFDLKSDERDAAVQSGS
jgi:hypothetical protein